MLFGRDGLSAYRCTKYPQAVLALNLVFCNRTQEERLVAWLFVIWKIERTKPDRSYQAMWLLILLMVSSFSSSGVSSLSERSDSPLEAIDVGGKELTT